MKKYFIISFGLWFFSNLCISGVKAQECQTTEDLLYNSGTLSDRKKTPLQGFVSDFSPAEKTMALKTLNSIESHIIKDFKIQGGNSNAWFAFNELYYFDTFLHKSYEYKMGFYPFVCVNGKKIITDEYISDFKVTANPSVPVFFSIPSEYESSNSFFDADRTKIGGPRISIFRYLIFPDSAIASAINNGNGYYEDDKGDVYNNRRDIYRIWYITLPGKKLLTEVNRREYLNSLLEFYDREKMLLTKRNETKLAESKKYKAQYEKSGNKAMVQSHSENIQAAEKELAEVQKRYLNKKERVTQLLNSKSEVWLNQVATINPELRNNRNCNTNSDFERTGYFTFGGFDETVQAAKVYKWNPEYLKLHLQSPAEPLFLKVAFRYKANTPFTLNIKDNFIKNLSLDPLQKLLVTN